MFKPIEINLLKKPFLDEIINRLDKRIGFKIDYEILRDGKVIILKHPHLNEVLYFGFKNHSIDLNMTNWKIRYLSGTLLSVLVDMGGQFQQSNRLPDWTMMTFEEVKRKWESGESGWIKGREDREYFIIDDDKRKKFYDEGITIWELGEPCVFISY